MLLYRTGPIHISPTDIFGLAYQVCFDSSHGVNGSTDSQLHLTCESVFSRDFISINENAIKSQHIKQVYYHSVKGKFHNKSFSTSCH